MLKIHRKCQRDAANSLRKRRAEKVNENTAKKSKKTTRKSVSDFESKSNCFFCTQPCGDTEIDPKHPDRADVHRSEYKEFRDVILRKCQQMDDDEARAVERRVLSSSDFVAAEARYHGKCRDLFNIKATKTNMASREGTSRTRVHQKKLLKISVNGVREKENYTHW